MRKILFVFAAFIVVFAASVNLHATALEGKNNPYGKLSMEWKTDATRWIDEIQPVTVAAVMTTWTTREAVELAERMPVIVTPIQAEYNTEFYRPWYLELDRPELFRVAGAAARVPAEVVLVGRIAWGTFPFEVRYNLLRQVKEDGAGLILVNPLEPLAELAKLLAAPATKEENTLMRGVLGPDLAPLAVSTAKPKITTFRFGKGRVVFISYADGTVALPNEGVAQYHPFSVTDGYKDLFPDESSFRYDCQMAALSRAVLWAAGRKSAAVIERVSITGDTAQVTLSGNLPGRRTKALIRVRDARAAILQETKLPAAKEMIVRLSSNLPAGPLFLDVFLPGCDWYTEPFSLLTELKPDVALAPAAAKPGDIVTVNARVPDNLPTDARLTVTLADIYGDILARQETTVTPQKEESFPFIVPADVRCDLLTAAVEIREGDRLLGRCRRYLPVARTIPTDDFTMMGWSDAGARPASHLARLVLSRFAAAGIDISYVPAAWGGFPPLSRDEMNRITCLRNAENGLKTSPFATSIAYFGKSPDRSPDLCDPAFRASLRESLKSITAAYAPYGCPFYSLGDESQLSCSAEVSFTPAIRALFVEWVRKRYANDLAAVNAAWGTEMKDWNEIAGETKEEAVKRNRFGRWLDFRLFMYSQFDEFLRFGRDAIREVDPLARVGNEGTPGSDYIKGYRWDSLCSWYGGLYPYTGPNEEEVIRIARSFLGKDTYRGPLFGSYSYEFEYKERLSSELPQEEAYDRLMRQQVWFSMGLGMNSIFWWTLIVGHGAPGPSGFAPDLTPLPFFSAALEEAAFMKSGVAKLLLNCAWTDDRVAVLYSPLSTIQNAATGNISWGQAALDFCSLLEHSGIQYSFVSEDDLAAGRLDRKRFDALVCPACSVLENASVRVIEQFLAVGGKVLADQYPGLRDEHGTLRDKEPFGGKVMLYPELNGGYRGMQGTENGHIRLAGFRSFVEKAGLSSWYRLTVDGGVSPLAVFSATFIAPNGGRYLLVLPSAEAPKTQNVLLRTGKDTGRYGYNLREKTLLSAESEGSYRLTLNTGRGELFAFLPYRITGVRWAPETRRIRPGGTLRGVVTVSTNRGKPDLHVVSARFFRPDGVEVKHYFTKLMLRNGKGDLVLSLPLNAPPGRWRILLTEIVSGKSLDVSFKVSGGVK